MSDTTHNLPEARQAVRDAEADLDRAIAEAAANGMPVRRICALAECSPNRVARVRRGCDTR